MTREEILKRVETEEFKKRCLAVNICPYCGERHQNVAVPNPYNPVVKMVCLNKDCEVGATY